MLKKIFLTTVMAASFAVPAFASEPPPHNPCATPESGPAMPPEPPQGNGYWVCSAHNTEDDFWLHYGPAKQERCDAEECAVKKCEEFEKQKCEVHDCRFFIH